MNEPTFRVDVTKEQFVFSAAHFITVAGDICERLHGHNYGVRCSIGGPLDENRYVADFIAVRDAVLEETQALDHHVILPKDHEMIRVEVGDRETVATFRDRRWVFPNEDCVILPVVNTTAEEIARVIAERVREATRESLPDHLQWIEVAVDENHGQWGVCRLPWQTS